MLGFSRLADASRNLPFLGRTPAPGCLRGWLCAMLETRILCKESSQHKMANTYSALKRVRETERRTETNRKNKTRLRHQIRAMRRALTEKDAKAAAELLPKTFSLIDRSAKNGIIKKNTAARYKSNLHLKVKALEK